MHNADIPSIDDLLALSEEREGPCLSIYVSSSPVAAQTLASRLELKNAVVHGERLLRERGCSTPDIDAVLDRVRPLLDDEEFWREQSRGLAIFASPSMSRVFRLPVEVTPELLVNDRFRLAQLLRVATEPHAAYVLVLSEKTARLVALGAGTAPRTIEVPGLPPDTAVLEHTTVADQAPMPRPQGRTGDRIEQQKYCRLAQEAILPILTQSRVPLLLAAPAPLAPAYLAISTYPQFIPEVLDGNHDDSGDEQVAAEALPVLERFHRAERDAWRERFGELQGSGRATADLSQAARAAAFGAVESLMIDPQSRIFGSLADEDGSLRFGDIDNEGDYSLVDEIAARVLRTDGRVMAVPSSELPGDSPVAAILRYPV